MGIIMNDTIDFFSHTIPQSDLVEWWPEYISPLYIIHIFSPKIYNELIYVLFELEPDQQTQIYVDGETQDIVWWDKESFIKLLDAYDLLKEE